MSERNAGAVSEADTTKYAATFAGFGTGFAVGFAAAMLLFFLTSPKTARTR